MNTLTAQDLQFIDNYLEHSDVLYADIRMEITDHVASAIEAKMQSGDHRGFYSIFKDFMVEHKANLINNNKQFIKSADKTILKRLGLRLIKLPTLLIFILVFVVSFKSLTYFNIDQLKPFIMWFPMLSIVPFCIVYTVALKVFKLSRFSGIERLAFIYMIFFQFFNLARIILRSYINTNEGYLVVAAIVALITTLSIVLVQLSISIIRQYKSDYKFV